jgi:hypothetical protein
MADKITTDQIVKLHKLASLDVNAIASVDPKEVAALAQLAGLDTEETKLLTDTKKIDALNHKKAAKGYEKLSHSEQKEFAVLESAAFKLDHAVVEGAWQNPGSQRLTSGDEVRRYLLSGSHPEGYINFVNHNVDKWLDEGKQIYVNKGNDGGFAVVTDGQRNADMDIYNEYQRTRNSRGKTGPIEDVEEARRMLRADIALKDLSSGMSIPAGVSSEYWHTIRSGGGKDLPRILKNLDSMYDAGERLTLTDGQIDTAAYHGWKNENQLKDATTAQNWISAKAYSGTDAEKVAWKPLADVSGLIRGYYESPGAIPLTIDADGKLDVTNMVNWERNQGGYEKYSTGKASPSDHADLEQALTGLREQGLVVDRAFPEKTASANKAANAVGNTPEPPAFVIYNGTVYNITVLPGGVYNAAPDVTAPPAVTPPDPATPDPANPAAPPPAPQPAGSELPLTMETNGTNFKADGGTVTVSNQPIKLTLTGTTDGKTATITGVTGVNTVTGTTQTIDGPEAARIINNLDMSSNAPATLDVKDGKIIFKGARDPHMLLDQLGADIYVAQKYAAEKQTAAGTAPTPVTSATTIDLPITKAPADKNAVQSITIPAQKITLPDGTKYDITLNAASSDNKANIKSATVIDDKGNTSTISGDKLSQILGGNTSFTINNNNSITVSQAALASLATNAVMQPPAPGTDPAVAADPAPTPTAAAPTPAAPPKKKGNVLEDNKFAIGAGLLALLGGMLLGGGGLMGLLIGLLLAVVAVFAVGAMADKHGFMHPEPTPNAVTPPAAGPAPAPALSPPAPSASTDISATKVIGDDGKLLNATDAGVTTITVNGKDGQPATTYTATLGKDGKSLDITGATIDDGKGTIATYKFAGINVPTTDGALDLSKLSALTSPEIEKQNTARAAVTKAISSTPAAPAPVVSVIVASIKVSDTLQVVGNVDVDAKQLQITGGSLNGTAFDFGQKPLKVDMNPDGSIDASKVTPILTARIEADKAAAASTTFVGPVPSITPDNLGMAKLLKDDNKTPVSAASDGTIIVTVGPDVSFTGKVKGGNFEISNATGPAGALTFSKPVIVRLNDKNEISFRDTLAKVSEAANSNKDVVFTPNNKPPQDMWKNLQVISKQPESKPQTALDEKTAAQFNQQLLSSFVYNPVPNLVTYSGIHTEAKLDLNAPLPVGPIVPKLP